MVTSADSSGEIFELCFNNILTNGQIRGNTKTLLNCYLNIKKPLINNNFPIWRKFDESYAKFEYNWYKSGDRSVAEIGKRARIWNLIQTNGLVNSNYGFYWKLNNQLHRIIKLLREDTLTRRAVISHYDIFEVQNYSKDTPCNLVLHFQYTTNNTLDLTIFARSIDLVYGFCNDQYCFSLLLQEICTELFADIGEIHYFISNLHIYEKHYKMNL